MCSLRSEGPAIFNPNTAKSSRYGRKAAFLATYRTKHDDNSKTVFRPIVIGFRYISLKITELRLAGRYVV